MSKTTTAAPPRKRAARTGGDVPLPQMPEPTSRQGAGRRTPRRQERAGKRAGMPVRAISVSVPASLAAAWKERARRDAATQVDVLLDAVSSQRQTLSGLVGAQRQAARPVLPPSDGLFMRRSGDGPTADPFVAVSLRLLAANVDVLDGLVAETGAESRSQLVVAALGPWLGQA